MPKFEVSATADGRLYLKKEMHDAMKLANGNKDFVAIATYGAALIFPTETPLEDALRHLESIRGEIEQRIKDEGIPASS